MENNNPVQETNLNQYTQIPTTPEQNNNTKKYLLPILGILAFLLILTGSAYYLGTKKASTVQDQVSRQNPNAFFTQLTPVDQSNKPPPSSSVNETANWKTYTNTDLSYSFKYPIEWANCPSNFGGGQTNTVIYFCSASLEPFDYIWTSFMDNPQNLNFQQLATQDLSDDIKNNFKYTTVTMGQNSAYITKTLPARIETENVFFKMSNNGYIGISYQPNNSASGFSETYSSYKIFQQILSTFKFTGQTSTIDTSSWKTYTNSSEFVFKYPSDWKVMTDISKFSYLSVRSSDYSLNTEGIQFLQGGAEIYITTSRATSSNIDEEFAKDSLGQQVAQSKRYVTVDGQKALQYDFSYESNTATDTRFIKNNFLYLIQYKYPKLSDKQKYWDVYIKLLESFKGL